MAYDKMKLYNHFGKLRFFHNHIAFQEAIQPIGNFYILDKELASSMDDTLSDEYEQGLNNSFTGNVGFGDYTGLGISSISVENQKVRDVFTNCNPSKQHQFTLPSNHGCFEWNLLCKENNSPNSRLGFYDDKNPLNQFSTHQIQKNIDTCFLWYHFTDASGEMIDNEEAISPIQWYIEYVYSDRVDEFPIDLTVTPKVVWGDDPQRITSLSLIHI